jgi:hypothetical protein
MYACPVDLRKMLWTAGGGSAGRDSAAAIDAAARTHYEAVAAFALRAVAGACAPVGGARSVGEGAGGEACAG